MTTQSSIVNFVFSSPKLSIVLPYLALLLWATPSYAAPSKPQSTASVNSSAGSFAVSTTWSGEGLIHDQSAHRQLAMVLAPTASPTAAKPKIGAVKKAGAERSSVRIVIPEDFTKAYKACCEGVKKYSVIGLEKARELGQWLGIFCKQMSHEPTMTPFGGPYAYSNTPKSEFQLWYMQDGRLKTVVRR